MSQFFNLSRGYRLARILFPFILLYPLEPKQIKFVFNMLSQILIFTTLRISQYKQPSVCLPASCWGLLCDISIITKHRLRQLMYMYNLHEQQPKPITPIPYLKAVSLNPQRPSRDKENKPRMPTIKVSHQKHANYLYQNLSTMQHHIYLN